MTVWVDGDAVEFEWTLAGGLTAVVAAGPAAHRRLPPASADGTSGRYFIYHTSLNEWEISRGTWDHDTQTMTRGEDLIIGSNGTSLVSFSAGTKRVAWVAGSADFNALILARGGGATINEVANSPGAYDFIVGSQYALTFTNPKHAYIKVMGPLDGPLSAPMYVALPDPELGAEGHRVSVEKGEASAFNVVIVGYHNPVATTANASTDVLTFTGYTPVNGDPIILRRGTLPGNLTAGTVYFVRDASGSTCKLALTVGATAIDLTSNGAGFVAFRGRKTLTRQDQFQGARVIGTVTRKWEIVEGGQQAPSAKGQDLIRTTDPEIYLLDGTAPLRNATAAQSGKMTAAYAAALDGLAAAMAYEPANF